MTTLFYIITQFTSMKILCFKFNELIHDIVSYTFIPVDLRDNQDLVYYLY